MILESTQLLSTAHRLIDGGEPVIEKTAKGRSVKRWRLNHPLDSILYSATHINHPSAVWTRVNSLHYEWLYQLARELCTEYTYRYEKVHKCEAVLNYLLATPEDINTSEWTDPPQAMPDDVKCADAVQAYRNYYNKYKRDICTWKVRPVPAWYLATSS